MARLRTPLETALGTRLPLDLDPLDERDDYDTQDLADAEHERRRVRVAVRPAYFGHEVTA